ncbi:hypothetical protein DRN43_00565 [Thermococci archaeon]|nr:MAG: hypothetical protein DRN43_00565 [Thermococci archaeon]
MCGPSESPYVTVYMKNGQMIERSGFHKLIVYEPKISSIDEMIKVIEHPKTDLIYIAETDFGILFWSDLGYFLIKSSGKIIKFEPAESSEDLPANATILIEGFDLLEASKHNIVSIKELDGKKYLSFLIDRIDIKPGDLIAVNWFNDPTEYVGVAELFDEPSGTKIGLDLTKTVPTNTASPIGFLEDAFSIEKLIPINPAEE